MKLADLHCDTPLELYKRHCDLNNDCLHISLHHATHYEAYLQCAAIWSDYRLTDEEAFQTFIAAAADFKQKADSYLTTVGSALPECGISMILCVEDARILCGDLSRLKLLHQAGVRILTLVWKGVSCIGGGWDTEVGLTAFGRTVVSACWELGILPDISHGSDTLCMEVLEMAKNAGRPVIATHSNLRTVCSHRRNLPDSLFSRIIKSGGIIGISLCPEHLTTDTFAAADHVLEHMAHAIALGGASTLCMGCDFDGIDMTPIDITNLSCMEYLYTRVADRFGSETADNIFFYNAYRFLKTNLY